MPEFKILPVDEVNELFNSAKAGEFSGCAWESGGSNASDLAQHLSYMQDNLREGSHMHALVGELMNMLENIDELNFDYDMGPDKEEDEDEDSEG